MEDILYPIEITLNEYNLFTVMPFPHFPVALNIAHQSIGGKWVLYTVNTEVSAGKILLLKRKLRSLREEKKYIEREIRRGKSALAAVTAESKKARKSRV